MLSFKQLFLFCFTTYYHNKLALTQIYNIFCQISHFYGDLANYQTLLQHTHQIPLHILVDFFRIRFSDFVGYAVAGEGAAAFFVAAEGADQVRVFDLFVEVADKAAASQVGGCDFVERADILLAGGWIIDYDRKGKACSKEHLLDCDIVLLLRDQREEFIEWTVLISLEYFLCDRVQWHTHCHRATVLCLAWNILYTSIYDISFCHLV